MINRWRLEKANPRAKLSPPRKQIVWYVEDTVPIEYRPYVEEGIREWNKAFEKIGFKDAIAVRWEEAGRDEFDPEDTNYCTFRWVTSDMGYAMSCLRANPITGEMIDGDVIFDAGFIRYWKQEYALLVGTRRPRTASEQTAPAGHRRGDQPDPGLEDGLRPADGRHLLGMERLGKNPNRMVPEVVPADQDFARMAAGQEPGAAVGASASSSPAFQRDFGLAAIAMADRPSPTTAPSRHRQAHATKRSRKNRAEEGSRARRSPSPRTNCPRSSSARRSSTS